ncbi:hypothetical protein ACVBEH_19800, partial [Roseateles sp. GG27B]
MRILVNWSLFEQASVDASGSAGGGLVHVGGGYQGLGEPRNAGMTVVGPKALINASATENGDGGQVVVWADGHTTFGGHIDARGGAVGGNGGQVETSGKKTLSFSGLVDARAPHGTTGTLLLDPTDITISTGLDTGTLVIGATFSDPTTTPSNLNTTTLQIQLSLASVTVDTSSALAGTGTIEVQNPILDWASANSLTLKANSAITVNSGATITNTGTGGVNFYTDGAVILNAGVTLAGGTFNVASTSRLASAASFAAGAGGTISTTGTDRAGGAVSINTSGALATQAITTAAGDPAIGIGLNAGAVTLTSAGSVTTNAPIIATGSAAFAASGLAGGAGGAIAITGGAALTLNGGISSIGGAGDGAGAHGLGSTAALSATGALALQGHNITAEGVSLTGSGVTQLSGSTVNAGTGTILVDGSTGAINLAGALTTTSNSATAITLRNAGSVALGN